MLTAFRYFCRHRKNYAEFIRRNHPIVTKTFEDVMKNLNDQAFLSLFRFLRADVLKLVLIVSQEAGPYLTRRNRYGATPLLGTCVVLSRLATPYRWTNRETLFMKHGPQLSENFREGVDDFVDEYGLLVAGLLHAPFIAERAKRYAEAVQEKTNALDNCIGFIDGTNIRLARPSDEGLQNVVYNAHKRFHALKFQAVVCPDGILLYGYGPVEGRRHDRKLYSRSELDEQLPTCLLVDGKQYCLYGDSGYNLRDFLQVLFQGSELNADQRAFNAAMVTERITVECLFKEIKLYWDTVDFPRKMRMSQAPVGTLYLARMVLHNLRTCFYGKQVSKYFRCTPPSAEDYLNSRGY